ncbi:MAG: B12-binding domain-containing radical SAM protein [Planctomycetia bacterium]|nr:B12-binding domain-containing radical SAM protein [Planctomycetia bacterium]
MADIVLINPRFEISFWGLELALPLLGKRANLPTACLPLLAALTPGEHTVTLIDENVEAIDFARLEKADIVGVTGMNVQRHRMREILVELKDRGIFTVVGGPWVTVQEDYFGELADVIFIGEAEDTWPQFLKQWAAGSHGKRYEQLQPTDMTKVPPPRFDLLKMRHYAFGSLQFSRGCPFQCEFCDIIITFGRRPRLKTNEQVITEIEEMHRQGMSSAFIVDDNLIGNKKAVKVLLAKVKEWQEKNGYPITFFTEASIDLADDAELMQAMVDCNITGIFIGVESPNEASLRETKKFQNVRSGGTIVEKIHRIQDAGLDPWCGMIVGFDADDRTIFKAQYEFLKQSRILHAMVGLLYAVPKTPLHKRLAAEGRLDYDDQPVFGTNVIPAQMSREEMRDGYIDLMASVYEPDFYFERLDSLYLSEKFRLGATREKYAKSHFFTRIKGLVAESVKSAYVFMKLMREVPEASLRKEYRRRIGHFLMQRRDPFMLFIYILKCAMHYHHYTLTRQMASRETGVVSTF